PKLSRLRIEPPDATSVYVSTSSQPRRETSAPMASCCASSPARESPCSSVLTLVYAITRMTCTSHFPMPQHATLVYAQDSTAGITQSFVWTTLWMRTAVLYSDTPRSRHWLGPCPHWC